MWPGCPKLQGQPVFKVVCACKVTSVMSDSLRPYGLLACQVPLSTGFSWQEYWSGLPCPPPGNLPDPGIKSMSLTSPALAGRFFTTSTIWEAWNLSALISGPQGNPIYRPHGYPSGTCSDTLWNTPDCRVFSPGQPPNCHLYCKIGTVPWRILLLTFSLTSKAEVFSKETFEMGIKMESKPASRSASFNAPWRCGDLEIHLRFMDPIDHTPLQSCGLETIATE